MIIYPQAIYPDPFRGGDNIMVLCDCYKPDGTPLDGNTRKECAEVMAKVSVCVKCRVPCCSFPPSCWSSAHTTCPSCFCLWDKIDRSHACLGCPFCLGQLNRCQNRILQSRNGLLRTPGWPRVVGGFDRAYGVFLLGQLVGLRRALLGSCKRYVIIDMKKNDLSGIS